MALFAWQKLSANRLRLFEPEELDESRLQFDRESGVAVRFHRRKPFGVDFGICIFNSIEQRVESIGLRFQVDNACFDGDSKR